MKIRQIFKNIFKLVQGLTTNTCKNTATLAHEASPSREGLLLGGHFRKSGSSSVGISLSLWYTCNDTHSPNSFQPADENL